MQEFDKMGSFYLGKIFSNAENVLTDNYYLYDSKDLTTHAVCVGMTGSGKTGLCINLIEEAAMDNIPALIIDPKGDMSNLALAFPDLSASDFEPWVSNEEAEKNGISVKELSERTAETWRDGLAKWGQDGERIRKMLSNVDIAVYTPGSNAGRKLSFLQTVELPTNAILEDSEALNDYVSVTVSGLLALLGIKSDALNGREHILLSNILLNEWKNGRTLDIATLIQLIMNPNIEKVGILPLDTFFSADDRMKLAMQLNNILASPQFTSWIEGEHLNISNLLYTNEGKPRISILSINHLNDQERMFFVSTVLNKMVSWMRGQQGTSNLRAILYMDEIFGYFPPVSNPPSKQPLITLLKQARAFGLGVVLATQNPVDLDYKGLSNIGTWFIGRLQTAQDKARLIEGLQTASENNVFDKAELEDIISNLPKRTFLVNNVHEDNPLIFQTRWAMSYLAGPLTKKQLTMLNKGYESVANTPVSYAEGNVTANYTADNTETNYTAGNTTGNYAAGNVGAVPIPTENTQSEQQNDVSFNQNGGLTNQNGSSVQQNYAPANAMNVANSQASQNKVLAPMVASGVSEFYLEPDNGDMTAKYIPTLYAIVDIHYEDTKYGVSENEVAVFNTPVKNGLFAVDWKDETGLTPEPEELKNRPSSGLNYGEFSKTIENKTNFAKWEKDLKEYVYRNKNLTIFYNKTSKMYSMTGESSNDFALRSQQVSNEIRDAEMAKIREKYSKKIAAAEEKIRKAEQVVERETDQANAAKLNTAVSIGSTIFDSLLGNKRFGKTTLNKAAGTARAANRAKQQESDIARAQETVDVYRKSLATLQEQLQVELDALNMGFDGNLGAGDEVRIAPKKQDISVRAFALLWIPTEV